MWTEWE